MIQALESTPHRPGPAQPGSACDRVLIAENDPMLRRILRSWLQSWGYHVTTAEDSAKAWQILQQNQAPQLLILDWTTPARNGLELCRLVRKRGRLPYQYILLAAAKEDKRGLVWGPEAGADDYLSKPFDKSELYAGLRRGRRILMLQDEHMKAVEALHFQATHDGLTGIWNRTAIFDLLRREFEIVGRSVASTGVMMLDVDHFKNINDAYGHQAGDTVLQEVTRRIQRGVRSYDLVGRYGGEEFLIVLPDCAADDVQQCAERIRLAMAGEPVFAEGSAISITVSVGTAIFDPFSTKEKEALAAADAALYQAKNSGRNRVVSLDLRYSGNRGNLVEIWALGK